MARLAARRGDAGIARVAFAASHKKEYEQDETRMPYDTDHQSLSFRSSGAGRVMLFAY
jgi:hypothetical protein